MRKMKAQLDIYLSVFPYCILQWLYISYEKILNIYQSES